MAGAISLIATAGGKLMLPLSSISVHRFAPIFYFLMFIAWTVVSETQDILVPKSCFFGKECVLPCQVDEPLSEITWEFKQMPVQWFPRSRTLHQHNGLKNRTSLNDNDVLNGNCTLTIKDMKPEDIGIHKCTLKSQNGNEKRLYYNISVYAPVEKVTIVKSGDILICSSEGVYPEPQCRWSHGFSNSSPTVYRDNQGLYSINCTSPLVHNALQYNCTVSTPFSSKKAIYTELPPFTISGTKMTLPCGSSWVLAKSVIWKFNNSETIVDRSRKDQPWEVFGRWSLTVKTLSKSGDLTLKKLSSDHLGLFTCALNTDTETYVVNIRLEKKGFADWIPVLFTVVLTVVVFGAYKCFQVTTKVTSQPPTSQPSLPQSSSSAEDPPDRFHAVRIICGLLGLGSVLPWHFFVMALLYYQHHVNSSDHNWSFSLIVLVSQLPQLLFVGVRSFFVSQFTPRKHTTCCLIGVTLLFVVVLVTKKMSEENFFAISLCALWLASLLSTMAQHHLSVEVNSLPIRSFADGQAFAGIIASVFMIIFVAVTGDVELPVFCHFVFAFVVSVFTLVSYCLLPRLEFAKHYFNRQHRMKDESSLQLQNVSDGANNNSEELPQSPESISPNLMKYCRGFYVFMLVQVLTFCVYPAITANIQTTYPGNWDRFFILVCSFLIFNVFDFIGQKIAPVSQAHKHFLILFPILVVIHIVCIVLFMFCNVQPRAFHLVNVHIFNDAVFVLIMALFSFLNGFLTHLTMFYVPNTKNDAGDGRAKIIQRALGPVIGALLSFALRAVI